MSRTRPIHLVLALLLLIALSPARAQSPFGQEKVIDVLGQRIHYVEAGSGPAVVLLHGLGADATTWLPTLPALAPQVHVYALDQLGFGQSDKPMIPYRLGTLVDFLTGFLDRVAPQSNVVTNTTDPRGVVAYVRDARVAWVVSSAAAGPETTVVPGPSSSDR